MPEMIMIPVFDSHYRKTQKDSLRLAESCNQLHDGNRLQLAASAAITGLSAAWRVPSRKGPSVLT